MPTLVKIIGALFLVEALIAGVHPGFYKRAVAWITQGNLIYSTALLSTVIGMLMLVAATQCHYPWVIVLIGMGILLFAIVLFAIHRERLVRFFMWVTKREDWQIRIFAGLEVILAVIIILAA